MTTECLKLLFFNLLLLVVLCMCFPYLSFDSMGLSINCVFVGLGIFLGLEFFFNCRLQEEPLLQ